MEKNLFHTLIDETLEYLTELKEYESHVMTGHDMTCHDMTRHTSYEMVNDPVTTAMAQTGTTPSRLPYIHKVDAPPPAPIKEELSSSSPQTPASPLKVSPVSFALHPPSPVQKEPMQELRTILAKVAPLLKLSTTIPNDEKAKKIKNAWKEQSKIPDVALLTTPGPSLPLLKNIAKAIELHFFPSKVIDIAAFEQSNSWDVFLNTTNLKVIVAPDSVVWSCKNLMRYYHEFPNKQERYLGKIPLLLLPDPSLYMKDPSLKRSLWNLLCQVLKPLKE